jgi:hypothetical protein
MKGCAIRRSRGIALLNVSSLDVKLPWPSDHLCNGGTWKIPVRPGAPWRSFQCCTPCTARPAKFPEENHTGFFSKKYEEIPVNLEKNPVNLEKNPVSLSPLEDRGPLSGSYPLFQDTSDASLLSRKVQRLGQDVRQLGRSRSADKLHQNFIWPFCISLCANLLPLNARMLNS